MKQDSPAIPAPERLRGRDKTIVYILSRLTRHVDILSQNPNNNNEVDLWHSKQEIYSQYISINPSQVLSELEALPNTQFENKSEG